MGDTTNLQATIAACPPGAARDVLAVLNDFGLSTDYDVSVEPNALKTLELGLTYFASEARCGSADDLAERLATISDDADGEPVFYKVWEDPAYTWLGTLHVRVPGHELWSSDCDADGNPVFNTRAVAKLADQKPGSFLDNMATLLGLEQLDAFDQLAHDNEHTVIDPDAVDAAAELLVANVADIVGGGVVDTSVAINPLTVPAPVIDAAFLGRVIDWSISTFGPATWRDHRGPLEHLGKELEEAAENPGDITEWADVILLAFDGAWRAGHLPADTLAAVRAKFATNQARSWPDWTTQPADVAIEHHR